MSESKPIEDRAEHLMPSWSNRGFTGLPAIPGAYGGQARAYESSAACGPHVWLAVTDPENPGVEATLHLTAENAVKLAEQLQYLVANHYQGSES